MIRDLVLAIILTAFLVAFAPFGLHIYQYDRLHYIFGFGVVCLGTMWTTDVVGYQILKPIFRESHWTLSRQILWGATHLMLLGFTNLCFAAYIDEVPLSWFGFARMEIRVILSAVLPLAVYILFRQNYLLKVNLADAKILNDTIHQTRPQPSDVGLLTFSAENERGTFQVTAADLIYIVSEDNYVGFVYREGTQVKKTLLRSTLARVEETLKDRPEFFRCHRTFVANLSLLQDVEGNSQGYRLRLAGVPDSIPVARTRNAELKLAIQRARPA